MRGELSPTGEEVVVELNVGGGDAGPGGAAGEGAGIRAEAGRIGLGLGEVEDGRG